MSSDRARPDACFVLRFEVSDPHVPALKTERRINLLFSRRGSDLPALKTVTEKASSSALHVRRILASRRVLLVQDGMSAVHPDRAWSLRPPGENAGTGQADRFCLPRPPGT